MNKTFKIFFIISIYLYFLPSKGLNKEVTIYADEGYYPYSYKEEEDKKLKGFYVDIILEASKIINGYNIKIEPIPWKRGLAILENGTGFALIPPYLRKERTYIDPYSVPIFNEKVVLVCTKKYLKKIKGRNFPKDFNGAVVTINAGFALSDKLISAYNDKYLIKDESRNSEAAILKLAEDRVDCYANDYLSINSLIKEIKNRKNPPPPKKIKELKIEIAAHLSDENAYIGYTANPKEGLFPYKNDFINKMNKALKKLKNSGEINEILKKYSH